MPEPFAQTTPPGIASHGSLRRAVFIDKDGPLAETEAGTGRPGALRPLAEAGWLLVVLSRHAPALAHGAANGASDGLVEALAQRIEAETGVGSAGFFCQSHGADCQAPGCGGHAAGAEPLAAAAAALQIDLAASWMIGDVLDDVEAGRRAGCRTVFLDHGQETQWRLSPWRIPHHSCGDLQQAVAVILAG